MELGSVPWLLAGLTGAWFGWMAHRAGRNLTLWGVGGAAFALVTSTIVLGLGQAAAIPYSDHDRSVEHLEWVLSAVALIAILGWLLTMSLHRHHLAIWGTFRPDSSPVEANAADSKPGSAAPRK